LNLRRHRIRKGGEAQTTRTGVGGSKKLSTTDVDDSLVIHSSRFR
jgi:hypothetical protein